MSEARARLHGRRVVWYGGRVLRWDVPTAAVRWYRAAAVFHAEIPSVEENMGWFKCPAGDWPAVAAALPLPWPVEAIRIDLIWWDDHVRFTGERHPGCRVLAARWGVSESRATRLLRADGRMTDERRTADGSLTDGRRTAGKENVDNRANPADARRITDGRLTDGRRTADGRAAEDNHRLPALNAGYSTTGTDVAARRSEADSDEEADIHGGAGGRAAEGTTSTSRPPSSTPLPPTREVSPTTGGAVGMVSTTGDGQPRLALPSAAAITRGHPDAMGGGRAAASGNPALPLDGAPAEVPGRRRRGASARKSGPPTEAEMQAWGAIVRAWQEISGRLPNWSPEAGSGAFILQQIRALGADLLIARFQEAKGDRYVLQKAREDRGLDIGALLRGENGLTERLDRAVADRALQKGQNGTQRVFGVTDIRPMGQNAPQGQMRPVCDPLAAWDETAEARRMCVRTSPPYLDHGPRLSPDPDEHRRRADAWRQGLWADWCGSTHPLERDRIRDRWMQAYRGAM